MTRHADGSAPLDMPMPTRLAHLGQDQSKFDHIDNSQLSVEYSNAMREAFEV
ncbi:hypothetical protein HDE78_003001 [Rhodanobacter sp. K2T2]|nr:hypothetical protein [Rhodanobacter sp. K2T2]